MFDYIRQDFEKHTESWTNRGFWALAIYRFGRWTKKRKNKASYFMVSKIYGLLRLFSEITTNVSLDPQTTIGEGFHIIHPDGPISIHPKAIIGKRCGIMHNVTIGTNMGEGVPVIGDDVFIGVGATILGNIKIGDRVRISANTLVVNDVPPDSIAIGVPAKIYPRLSPLSKKQSIEE